MCVCVSVCVCVCARVCACVCVCPSTPSIYLRVGTLEPKDFGQVISTSALQCACAQTPPPSAAETSGCS